MRDTMTAVPASRNSGLTQPILHKLSFIQTFGSSARRCHAAPRAVGIQFLFAFKLKNILGPSSHIHIPSPTLQYSCPLLSIQTLHLFLNLLPFSHPPILTKTAAQILERGYEISNHRFFFHFHIYSECFFSCIPNQTRLKSIKSFT